jgi:hypothetical protein
LILTVDNVDACVFVADGMLTCRHDHRVMAMERQRSCSFLPAGEASSSTLRSCSLLPAPHAR